MKMLEVYVRGNSIKYVTIPDEVLDMVQEEDLFKESESQSFEDGRCYTTCARH